MVRSERRMEATSIAEETEMNPVWRKQVCVCVYMYISVWERSRQFLSQQGTNRLSFVIVFIIRTNSPNTEQVKKNYQSQALKSSLVNCKSVTSLQGCLLQQVLVHIQVKSTCQLSGQSKQIKSQVSRAILHQIRPVSSASASQFGKSPSQV